MATVGRHSQAYAQLLADRFYRRYFETINVMTACNYCKESFPLSAAEELAISVHYCSPECKEKSYTCNYKCECCYSKD